MRSVTERSAELLRKHVFAGYELKKDCKEQVHPSALCPNCRLTLTEFGKVWSTYEVYISNKIIQF